MDVNRLQTYLDAISAYEREFKPWETRVDKILKRYRDEKRDANARTSRFNVLWSNVQTLSPACFSRLPQPDVSRRFRDNDPVGRVAALILERALEFEVQHYNDYRMTMKQSVQDRFLGGRGTSWARYEPKFKKSSQVTEDVEDSQELDYECAPTDYVHWKDFGHSVARTWEEVTLVWRKVYMNENAVVERFGKKIAKVLPYDATPEDLKRANRDNQVPIKKQALIYELADKETGSFVWLSKSYKSLLDEREDPLGLKDFFPCPQPLYATITNESLIPVPDFTLYQDQANDLDTLADRISGLIKMLQVKGVYDASADASLSRLFTEGENGILMPVKNWAAFAEKQGLKGQIDILDLKMIADALKMSVEAFQQKKSEVDELSGVIDVMRGEVDPKEKLGQTQMKGKGATLRLSDMQKAVAQYATNVLQLKAQIICTKFSPKTIASIAAVDQLSDEDKPHVFLMSEPGVDPMTGQQTPPQPIPGPDGQPQPLGPAMELLIGKDRIQDPEAEAPNPLRSFRIEVSADSLVEMDEAQEKQDRMEMLTAFGAYLKQAAEVGAVAPALIPLVVEIGKFGIQAFKVGKAIEGTFDQALDQLKQQATQPQKSPEQVKAETAEKEGQIKIAVKEKEMQLKEKEMGMKEQHMQREMEMDSHRQQMEGQMQQQEMMNDAQMQQQHMQMEQQGMAMEQQHQKATMGMKDQMMQRQHQMKMQQMKTPKRPQ